MSLLRSLALGALIAAATASAPTYADYRASAVAYVHVTVRPNVKVVALAPSVNAGTVQTGSFTAQIIFQINANKEDVSFQVDASALYKANDPTASSVTPIPLLLSAGVEIQLPNGAASVGHSNVLAYQGAAGPVITGFPTVPTETAPFTSSQNGRFSQAVTLKVTWNQTDPQLPGANTVVSFNLPLLLCLR